MLEVFTTVQTDPWLPLALLGVWMLCRRLAPRLAIVTVLAAGVALCLGRGDLSLAGVAVSLTRPAWVTPAFDPVVCLGIGIPLFAVTLTTQNLPGFAMVRSAGFTPPVAASLGATGLAQCYELTRQLRGTAGPTQVAGARTALQHNLGLGGACVVTLYQAA